MIKIATQPNIGTKINGKGRYVAVVWKGGRDCFGVNTGVSIFIGAAAMTTIILLAGKGFAVVYSAEIAAAARQAQAQFR